MKKVKLETRLENAVNAFFKDEHQFKNTQLSYFAETELLANERTKTFTEKADSFISPLKYIFFFLPGSFALYFFTLLNTYFFSYFGFDSVSIGIFLGMCLYMLAFGFMTLVGIGSIKEIKNLVVPFTIICFAAIFGIITLLLPIDEKTKENICFYYSAFLFPVALIIANLVKNWVNEK